MNFNLTNIMNDPATNGFVAGIYLDGSTIYGGVGDFSVCFNQNPAPSRVMTGINAGAYSSCSNGQLAGENYDKISPQYFYNHADLKWVQTTPLMASSVPGAVLVNGMFVGRKHIASKNGTYQQVGKIYGGKFYYKIPGKNGEFTSSTADIDVLACVVCKNGGSGAFCCLNGANNANCSLIDPCGTLLNYPRFDVTQLGLASGVYYDGSIVYPGVGDFSVCGGQNPGPSRVVSTFVATREPGSYQRFLK